MSDFFIPISMASKKQSEILVAGCQNFIVFEKKHITGLRIHHSATASYCLEHAGLQVWFHGPPQGKQHDRAICTDIKDLEKLRNVIPQVRMIYWKEHFAYHLLANGPGTCSNTSILLMYLCQ